MSIDNRQFMYDATMNMVSLLEKKKSDWGIKDVVPFQATFPSVFPGLEVNAVDCSFENIESHGGYLCSIGLEIYYIFQQFSESFAKEELDKKTSDIALYIIEHPSLEGYCERIILNSITITALPAQTDTAPIVTAVINVTVEKELFLNYQD